VAVTLSLAKRLGTAGYGQIEFAFNLVFWMVLLVREGFDVIAAREIARHPRLVRKVVEHVLAIRLLVASVLLTALVVGTRLLLPGETERAVLGLYGLMLLTTALGLDFVYRGLEKMGLVALSMFVRTSVYAVAVWFAVRYPEQVIWVPILLITGEVCGIALVWAVFVMRYGLPRPRLRQGRALRVFLHRGRTIYLIQVSQALVASVDILVVGLMSGWTGVGLYSASHRMVVAVLTFGLIFQQVAFPSLARSWRSSPEEGRRALNGLVRVLVLGFLPIAVGTSVLAVPLVACLFGPEYRGSAPLLALEIWRAPLLSLAFLYQTTLIALNKEALGVRLLIGGAIGAVPLTALLRWGFGLPGAAAATVLVSLSLAVLGYVRLSREGRQPAWHHQLYRPLVAVAVLVPVSLLLARWHVGLGVLGGAIAYLVTILACGGLKQEDLQMILPNRASL
jgi:O-antigen/teichoic acid export membrane protein